MARDLEAKGLQPIDLARMVEVAPSTVGRFLSGEIQTARMAGRLARALGYKSPRRYVVAERTVLADDTRARRAS